MREWQQRVWLDRERVGGSLHIPAAAHAAQLGGERRAARGRHVLDHAVAVHEVELVVGKRQPFAGVGLYERAGVALVGRDVGAGDVEPWLQRP